MFLAIGLWIDPSTDLKELAQASSWLLTALEAGHKHIDTTLVLYGVLDNVYFGLHRITVVKLRSRIQQRCFTIDSALDGP
ncbi:hypothetical protein BDR07DRAFT_1414035 [Suillus spraguei]|nr:hypothetical protein BDR07DRAFT_1414035 [Suillus spraguei]